MSEPPAPTVTLPRADLEAVARLVEHLHDRVEQTFAEGYRLGYESGHDVGFGAAELEIAEAGAAMRRTVLAEPEDGWEKRVAAAEAHSRALALRQWSNPRAWESVKGYAHPGMHAAIDALRGRP